MTDADTRLMRYRLVETLVELASPAQEQLDLLFAQGGFSIVELPMAFWDWFRLVPRLSVHGALSAEALEAVNAVDAALEVVNPSDRSRRGAVDLCTEEALRKSPEWEAVRAAARAALAAFRDLGISTPRLTDEDFNMPRTDAP
jgi:hypothetical protein